jgi:DNA-binding transcriptional LysR family regulator
MNVRGCEYIVAIAEEGNISQAARALSISQPTLSAYLSQTEAQLGYQLFTYARRTMTPTQVGEIYIKYCRKIIETRNRTYHMISAFYNSGQESFTVGVTPHRGARLFARVYPKFMKRYPEIMVHVKEGYIKNLRGQLVEGKIDLIIGSLGQADMKDFHIISDTKEALRLCVPKFHPMAKMASDGNTIAEIHEFQDIPFVMWGKETIVAQILEEFFRENNVKPTGIYESNNASLIDSMLSSGIGAGFLPGSYCKPASSRVYFDMWPPLSLYNGVTCRKGEALTEAQRYFAYLIIMSEQDASYTKHYNEEAKALIDEFGEDAYES